MSTTRLGRHRRAASTSPDAGAPDTVPAPASPAAPAAPAAASAASEPATPPDSPAGRSQVWAALARFAGFGLLALLLVTAGTIVIAERATRGGMLREAERTARHLADKIIAPVADDAVRGRDPAALQRIDEVMGARIADGSLMRVKVWSADSVVVWSDDARLIGQRYPLEEQDAELLRTLGATAEFTSLDREENVYEQPVGEVVETYVGFVDRTGKPLLLELYVPVADLEEESRAQLRTLLPITLGGPALLLLILLPLALTMAHRIDAAGAERSALLRHAVAASALERRRIAGDLHDGVVQDLAGIGYALPAIGSSLPDLPETAGARQNIDRVTEVVKRDIAALRAVITDIYPPDLHEGGLVPASRLLVSEVRYAGVEVDLDLDPTVTDQPLPIDAAVLGYRVLRETLRNVTRHAEAATAHVSMRVRDGDLVIVVADDGVGFDPAVPAPDGHFGLRLLEDALEHVGGRLWITSTPHRGSVVTARFPVRWGGPG